MAMVEITVELEDETFEKLEHFTKLLNKTKEELINEAIDIFLDNYCSKVKVEKD